MWACWIGTLIGGLLFVVGMACLALALQALAVLSSDIDVEL